MGRRFIFRVVFMVGRRVWAFAREGTTEYEDYAKSRDSWRRRLVEVLGPENPSEKEVGDFFARIIARIPVKPRGKEVGELLLRHFSPSDALLPAKSISFGIRGVKKLGLADSEKPVAALFLARAHRALEGIYRDRDELEAMAKRVTELRDKPSVALRDFYDVVLRHRLAGAAKMLEELRKETDKMNIPREKRTELERIVFGLCDVPEALWLGEQEIEKIVKTKYSFRRA